MLAPIFWIFLGGNDELHVSPGATGSFTTAYMGAGHDLAVVRAGDGRIFGEEGDDVIFLYSDGYVASGGLGADRIHLSGNDLYATGDEGRDYFRFDGQSLNVNILGGAGRDIFFADVVVSGTIRGGDGDDSFEGFANSAGNEVYLLGGAGHDVYRLFGTNPATVIEAPGEGVDTVSIARGVSYTLPGNVENLFVRVPGSPTDSATLIGNDLANIIAGHNNSETIRGAGGSDRIFGFGGDDAIYGGNGNDVLVGALGNDLVSGGDGHDVMFGGPGNNRLYGGNGNDRLYGGIGNDRMFGRDGDDVLSGGAGSDLLHGGGG